MSTTVLRDIGKALLCGISCVLLVLLVPSSAWSADGEVPSSEPSPSSSPAPESGSTSEGPQSSDSSSPSSSGSPSGSSTPSPEAVASSEAPSETPAAEPVPSEPETVYVVTEPPAAEPEPSNVTIEGEPAVVALSDEDRALVGLAACLLALGVGARIVGSFGG